LTVRRDRAANDLPRAAPLHSVDLCDPHLHQNGLAGEDEAVGAHGEETVVDVHLDVLQEIVVRGHQDRAGLEPSVDDHDNVTVDLDAVKRLNATVLGDDLAGTFDEATRLKLREREKSEDEEQGFCGVHSVLSRWCGESLRRRWRRVRVSPLSWAAGRRSTYSEGGTPRARRSVTFSLEYPAPPSKVVESSRSLGGVWIAGFL